MPASTTSATTRGGLPRRARASRRPAAPRARHGKRWRTPLTAKVKAPSVAIHLDRAESDVARGRCRVHRRQAQPVERLGAVGVGPPALGFGDPDRGVTTCPAPSATRVACPRRSPTRSSAAGASTTPSSRRRSSTTPSGPSQFATRALATTVAGRRPGAGERAAMAPPAPRSEPIPRRGREGLCGTSVGSATAAAGCANGAEACVGRAGAQGGESQEQDVVRPRLLDVDLVGDPHVLRMEEVLVVEPDIGHGGQSVELQPPWPLRGALRRSNRHRNHQSLPSRRLLVVVPPRPLARAPAALLPRCRARAPGAKRFVSGSSAGVTPRVRVFHRHSHTDPARTSRRHRVHRCPSHGAIPAHHRSPALEHFRLKARRLPGRHFGCERIPVLRLWGRRSIVGVNLDGRSPASRGSTSCSCGVRRPVGEVGRGLPVGEAPRMERDDSCGGERDQMSTGTAIRVGADVVAVHQVAESVDSFGSRYLERIYTRHELSSCAGSPAVRAASLAARFAAKEATIKVLRPVGHQPDWRSVEVRRHSEGWCTMAQRVRGRLGRTGGYRRLGCQPDPRGRRGGGGRGRPAAGRRLDREEPSGIHVLRRPGGDD